MDLLKQFLNKALDNHSSREFKVTQGLLSVATVVSIITIILETVYSFARFETFFLTVEWICVLLFTLEYIARITISSRKLRYVFGFWGIIDLVTILPTFLGLGNWTFLKTFRVLRILRLLRILRIAKISRIYLQTHDISKGEQEIDHINFVIYFLALFSGIISFGAAMYAVEHTQEAYANIPLAMLQSARILLGGIGEIPPVTLSGEIIMIVGRLVGLALFGLLISVIGVTLNHLLFGHHKK